MEKSSINEDNFHFFPANHDIHRSDRQAWELEKARALSHSARIAHLKKKKKEQDNSRTLSRTTIQIPSAVENGRLDPFVSLSMDLTIEERNLLQGYLVTVPQEFYGTTAASALCPVRDVTLGVLASNQILLSWAILFMQYRNALLRNTHPEKDTLLLRRRQQTYKIISTKVVDQQFIISEEAMYGLAFSALIEHRTGDKLTAQKHLQACLTVKRLRLQRGLSVLSYPLGTLCIPVCARVGIPRYFDSLEEVRGAGYTLKKFLWFLQDWRYSSGQESSNSDTFESVRTVWTEPDPCDYHSVQKQKSALHRHLARVLQETSGTDDRLCLAILTTLSLSILAFSRKKNDAMRYLQLVTRCFSESDSTAGTERSPVTILGMMYIVTMGIDTIQSAADQQCIVDLWQIVEMVEFLMLAAPSSRARVKQSLFAWIFDDIPTSAASDACDHIFLEHIIEDVEASWLSQHSCCVQTLSDCSGHVDPAITDQRGIARRFTESAKNSDDKQITQVASIFDDQASEDSKVKILETIEEIKDPKGW